MKLEDRKELAEVLKVLAADLKNSDKFVLGVFTPDEVLSDVRASVERVAAKYRRWADELLAEPEPEEKRVPKVGDTVWGWADHPGIHRGWVRGTFRKTYTNADGVELHDLTLIEQPLIGLCLSTREIRLTDPNLEQAESKPEKRKPKVGDTVWVGPFDKGWSDYRPAFVYDIERNGMLRLKVFCDRGAVDVVQRTEAVRLTDPNLEQAGFPK